MSEEEGIHCVFDEDASVACLSVVSDALEERGDFDEVAEVERD